MMKYETPFLSILELEEVDIVTASTLKIGSPNDDTVDWNELTGW